jgi:serine phosphatase RsbU (regulator of sigma subunit)
MKRVWTRDGKAALLILYGAIVLALTAVGLLRQWLLVRQIRAMGSPGFVVRRLEDGQGYRVIAVQPGSPAAAVLQAGDRVLRVGDLDLYRRSEPVWVFRLSDMWQYEGQPVAPGRKVPVLLERSGKVREVALRFGPGGTLEKQFGPDTPSFTLFAFGTLLPSRLTLLGFLIVGWIVLLRRPASRDAQLCFLLLTTSALSFSYALASPGAFPMPLRWLAEHPAVVAAWITAFALPFAGAVPEIKPREKWLRLPLTSPAARLILDGWPRMVTGSYLLALAITALAVLSDLWPAVRPSWWWLSQRFWAIYWLPAWLLFWVRLLHNAVYASTSAGRRQAQTVMWGIFPWLALQAYSVLAAPVVHPALGVAQSAALLLAPVSLAYAILRQGLLDLGLVVRRGLMYGAVIAVGVAGYYLLVLGTSRLFLLSTGQTSPLATMAATLLLATLLRPVALFTRRWVDQAFYRDRLATARRLREMTQEILSLLDRDAILSQLTIRLPAVFPARSATLLLRDPADGLFKVVPGAGTDAKRWSPVPGGEEPALSGHRAPGTEHAREASLLPEESGLLRLLQQSGRSVTTYDLAGSPDEGFTAADRAVVRELEGVLWVPLLLRGRLIGTVALGWKASEEIYTDEEREALCLIANEAAIALENAALSSEREKQARLQQEVAIGRSIQLSLLAPARLQRGSYEILSRSEPATEVGGDFYNVFDVGAPSMGSDAKLGILVGDVAGKGVPAALFMAVTTTLIQGQGQLLPSPGETLAAANAELYRKMRQTGGTAARFVTAVYGVLDTARREIRLASAGQTPPIYWPAGELPRYVPLTGVPLGALPASTYEETLLRLSPGDWLLFCSDGFIEERDAAGEAVGYEGLLRRLQQASTADRSAPGSGVALIEAVFGKERASPTIPDDALTVDDRTLVLIAART